MKGYNYDRDPNYYQDKRIKDNFKVGLFLMAIAAIICLILSLINYIQTGVFEMPQ